MKIAILFYGYARTFCQLKELYKNHFPKDADVFIQTYETFYAKPENETVNSCDFVTYTTKDVFDDTFNNIVYFDNPVFSPEYAHNIVKQYKLNEKNEINQYNFRTFCLLQNIKKVINAKKNYEAKNNFIYDCVILTRLDLKLYSPIIIPHNLNKIYFPIGEGFFPDGKRKIGCAAVFGTKKCFNDQIIVGNSKNINILESTYDKIINYHYQNIMINTETLLGIHCMKNNVNFEPYDICTYEIFR